MSKPAEITDLAKLIQKAFCQFPGMDWVYDHEAEGVAAAILTAGYRREV